MGKYTREDLKMLQSMTLDQKINHAISMFQIFYMRMDGKVYRSFSGGKDSTVLRHLTDKYCKGKLYDSIKDVYVDTGLEYPEIKEFVKSFGDVEIIRPKMNFKEVITKYGYPIISKAVANVVVNARLTPDGSRWKRIHGDVKRNEQGKSPYDYSKWLPLMELPIKISDECCKVMKKAPFKSYQSKTGLNPITAMTAQESLFRTQAWIGTGCNAFDMETGKGKSAPLSPWLEQDILHYIKRYDVKLASVYGDVVYMDGDGNPMMDNPLDFNAELKCTGCDRTGCMFCAFGAHLEKGETRFQRIKRTHPKQYEYMMGGGEWVYENGKQIWVPNKMGLGFANVFDMVNEIYGNHFYRYE